jgi:hypothetical protein
MAQGQPHKTDLLEAWRSARAITASAADTAEALYAAYWLAERTGPDEECYLVAKAIKEASHLRHQLQRLEAALGITEAGKVALEAEGGR